ncbi:DNRLRE domain-containing protein [Streptomyces sp. NPDC004311]|uniref:DNRLRE domain-containing protein n=1 Tax=Streptomyces sp. NPDC004311 TaxID=3364698 RepID=UPI0036A94442
MTGSAMEAVAATPKPAPAAKPTVTEAADLASAHVAAKLAGRRVEALSERDESTTTWANPDGTVTTEAAAGPVRFRDKAGQWKPIDIALTQHGDGTVGAKAHPLGLKLAGRSESKHRVNGAPPEGRSAASAASAGAHDPAAPAVPLVSIDDQQGKTMALSWRGALPQPVLKGTLARYPDVLPSTDLLIESTRTGFEQFLELKDRQAVPGTGTVTLTLDAKGLEVRANKDRSLTFVDPGTGREAGGLPAPVMWDASVDARSGEHTRRADVGISVVQRGDQVDLTLTPDAAFLNDPKTRFPVTVDPAVNLGASFDTFVQQGYTTDQSAATELKLGNNGSGQVARSFLSFPMAKISGKQVLSASLSLWNFHSWSCTAKGWEVWDTGTPSTSSRWTAQPSWHRKWAGPTATKGHSASCADGWVSTDIKTLAQAWAGNGNSVNSLGIRAADEGDPFGWKKFNSGNAATNTPFMSVTYNTKPGQAVAMSPLTGATTNDTTPTLTGKATDADGNTVQLSYEIWTPTGTAALQSGKSAFAASGAGAPWTPATALAQGSYKWRAAVYDGTTWNGTWSPWQTFTVDTTAPTAPGVGSGDFPAGVWSGTPDAEGRFSGTFTLTPPASGATAVQYRLDNGAWTTLATTGAPVTAKLTFPAGEHVLTARSKDAAGNTSAEARYVFSAGSGGAALLAPNDGDRPARRLTLSAEGRSTFTGVTYQYRRGETDTWKNVPAADVRTSLGVPLTSWPASAPQGKPAPLTWNVVDTLAEDGPIEIRAGFTSGLTSSYSPGRTATVDRNAGTAPTQQLGPGVLNTLTGDYILSATDASAFGMSVARTSTSRGRNDAPSGTVAIFGPGWRSDTVLDEKDSWSLLKKTSDTSVAIVGTNGLELGFTATAGGGWRPEPGAEELRLTGPTGGSFTLRDTAGKVTTFTKADPGLPAWQASAVHQEGLTGSTQVVSEAVTADGKKLVRPQRIVASTSATSAETCVTAPTAKGCRALEFVYATATTATGHSTAADFGDFTGQVKEIRQWSTEPGAAQATSRPVASYRYDAAGRLRQVWNPNLSQGSQNQYSYDSAGRVFWLHAQNEPAWTFTYGKAGNSSAAGDGMLLKLSRPGLKRGTKDVEEGTSTQYVVYDVPLTGAKAPYAMGAANVAAWGQADAPTDATAVLPPDTPVSAHDGASLTSTSYGRASVIYTNASGREVNTAAPGGHLTTTEYDVRGNIVRSLSAANRALALGLTPADVTALNELGIAKLGTAERAETLSARTVYDEEGLLAVETLGPLRRVALAGDLKSGGTLLVAAGTTVTARNWTRTAYDEGRPTDGTAVVENQVTGSVEGAQLPEHPTLMADARSARQAYDWKKGLQTKVTEDADGEALTSTTEYDDQGRAVKETLPGATGTDATTQLTQYWSAAGTGPCSGRPEWADLPCSTGPAGDITGGGSNPSKRPTITSEYNWWGHETKVTETVGAQSRTTTSSYDNAGRVESVKVTGGLGEATPETRTEYDPDTGNPVRTVSATAGTITMEYDKLGRLIAYTDADGGVTRTEYDLLDRPTRISDSVPSSVTYAYDHAVEPRGMATSATDSVAGTFGVTYDADGQVASEKLPGGYTLTQQDDAAGAVVAKNYTRDSDGLSVMTDTVTRSVHGEITQHSGWSSQAYDYDGLGRLTSVRDQTGDVCTTRTYTHDKRANRTSTTTATGAAGAACPSTAGTVRTHTYDSADRLTDAGTAYDAFGRTTALPGSTLEYYTNDLVRRQSTVDQRQTWALDPNHRIRSWTVEANAEGAWNRIESKLNHYDGEGDSPRWIMEDTATGELTRIVDSVTGEFSATTSAAGDTVLQLSNIHGDVALQLPLDPEQAPLVLDNDEYGNPRAGQPAVRYGWLGGKQRSGETLSGLTLLGVRLYNPDTGRFTSTDPDPTGGANAYAYCSADPVNCRDTTGMLDYTFKFQLGMGRAYLSDFFNHFMRNFGKIFPLKGRAKSITRVGQTMDLRDSIAGFGSINFNVRVGFIGSTSLRLDARKGSIVYGKNSYISFELNKPKSDSKRFGQFYLTVHGHTNGKTWADRWIPGFMYKRGANNTWSKLASNLRRHVW